jgi:hypothetical protein
MEKEIKKIKRENTIMLTFDIVVLGLNTVHLIYILILILKRGFYG